MPIVNGKITYEKGKVFNSRLWKLGDFHAIRETINMFIAGLTGSVKCCPAPLCLHLK